MEKINCEAKLKKAKKHFFPDEQNAYLTKLSAWLHILLVKGWTGLYHLVHTKYLTKVTINDY